MKPFPEPTGLKGVRSVMKFIRRLAARHADTRSERPVAIACLGDSVTHGVFDLFVEPNGGFVPHYLPDQCYPARLGRKLNEMYPGAAVTVINAGISGDGSKGGLERLERDALYFRPDVVLVNFGLNDSMNPDPDAGVQAYTRNMTEIFEKILASGAEAMLVTPNFMCSYVPAIVTGEKLRGIAAEAAKVQNSGILTRYVEAARGAAQRLNIPVADAYRRWEQMRDMGVDTTALLSNGINHPTVEMHDLFVEEIIRRGFDA